MSFFWRFLIYILYKIKISTVKLVLKNKNGVIKIKKIHIKVNYFMTDSIDLNSDIKKVEKYAIFFKHSIAITK